MENLFVRRTEPSDVEGLQELYLRFDAYALEACIYTN